MPGDLPVRPPFRHSRKHCLLLCSEQYGATRFVRCQTLLRVHKLAVGPMLLTRSTRRVPLRSVIPISMTWLLVRQSVPGGCDCCSFTGCGCDLKD